MLSSLQELIDKRKEALQSEKDLYDYQKSIDEKTDTVAAYKKQLEAYKLNNSEEAKATIQKIEVSLKDALDDLEQTQYEKYISDQEALMDSLYGQTEEWINTRLDDINGLISEAVSATNANGETIREQITADVTGLGGTLSSHMDSIWNGSGGLNGIVSGFIGNEFSAVSQVIGDIKATSDRMCKSMEQEGALYRQIDDAKTAIEGIKSSIAEVDGKNGFSLINGSVDGVRSAVDNVKTAVDLAKAAIDGLSTTIAEWNKEETAEPAYTETPAEHADTSSGNNNSSGYTPPSSSNTSGNSSGNGTITLNGGTFYEDSYKGGKTGNSREQWTGNEVEVTHTSKTGMVHIKDKTTGTILGWVDPKQLSGYAAGTENARKGWHMVAEKGDEIILDNDGNALLAKGSQLYPFKGGETVLDNDKTEEILDSQGNLIPLKAREMLGKFQEYNGNLPLTDYSGNLNMPVRTPDIPKPVTRELSVQNEIYMDFTLENVKNCDDIINELRSSSRFEKIMSEMVSSKMMGRNGYNKMRH